MPGSEAGAEAAIVQIFRDPAADRPAFALRGVGAGIDLDQQPDPVAAWAEASVLNSARRHVRAAEDPVVAEGPAVEAPAACRAWVAVGKDLLSVRISIALVLAQALARELV